MLALGRELVRELNLEPSVDTLGRWMAHHVAELMDIAEHGSTSSERRTAGREAVHTILEIWSHRATLPGNAYPLAGFKTAAGLLEHLLPGANPFGYSRPDSVRQRAAADAFDSVSRLILLLLAMEAGLDARHAGPRTVAALTRPERHALAAFQAWGELMLPQERGPQSGHEPKQAKPLDLKQLALEWCGRGQQALDQVRKVLTADI